MGISLHVIPRLAGVPLAHQQWPGRILWLMALGLGLRSVGHPIPGFMTTETLLEARDAFLAVLDRYTLADLIPDQRALARRLKTPSFLAIQ